MRDGESPARRAEAPWTIWLALALVLLAGAIFRLTDSDRNDSSNMTAVWVGFELMSVVGCFVWFQRISKQFTRELVISPLLIGLVLLSVCWEFANRHFWHDGRSFEFVVMCLLKNLMLGLGTVLFVKRFRLLALSASLFLVVFSTAMSRDSRVGILIGLYALGGVTWLCMRYWSSLRYRLLPDSEQRQIPWKRVSLAVLVCFAPFMAMGTYSEQIRRVSRVGMLSSGGTGDYDPFARDGVGDGDMLVAGQDNITSFAPIEDAPFRTSDDPSLYDLFDDTYDEPVQIKKQDRAIPLPRQLSKELERRLAKSNQASREFSTLRQNQRDDRARVGDLQSDALIYVSGRVPLHLRMETYDLFDGIKWYADELNRESPRWNLSFDQINGKPWLRTGRFSGNANFQQQVEGHAIKIATIDTNIIPLPVNVLGLHIDQVAKLSLFSWQQASILKMNRKRLPEAVTIRLSSALVDPDSIGNDHALLGAGRSENRAIPSHLHMQQVRELARDWTRHVDAGWPSVQTLVAKLKADYVHDREARPSPGCVFPMGEFLLRTRRGEDYQFATAAAIMLRSMGFTTRLVSGFYASPEKFDSRTGLTPIHAEDVHFWAEIYLGDGVWHTIEATPGYDILRPRPDWRKQIAVMIHDVGQWISRHLFWIAGGSLVGIGMFVYRRELIIVYYDVKDRICPARDERQTVLRAARQLERCLVAAGSRRPPGVSPPHWVEQQGLCIRVEDHDWNLFLTLWNRSLFLPGTSQRPLTAEVHALCRRIRRKLSASHMKVHLRGLTCFQAFRFRITNFFSGLSKSVARNMTEAS